MPHGHTGPDQPNDTRDDTIRDLATGRIMREFETETALDEGEGEEEATPPDVEGGVDGAAAGADVGGVVEGAEDGLEDEGDEDGDADDGVVFVDLHARHGLVSRMFLPTR